MTLKKLLASASVLLLVGAGCAPQTQPTPAAAPTPAVEPTPAPTTAPKPTVQPAPTPTPAPAPEPEAMTELKAAVTITAGGTFSPASLTVKAGTKVTWTNKGNLPVWPASNPHPVHTGYAGFDSKTDLRIGEEYSFTFDKKGSWDYHNHMNPSAKGTIIVE